MADDLDDEWWETDNRGREEGIVLNKELPGISILLLLNLKY